MSPFRSTARVAVLALLSARSVAAGPGSVPVEVPVATPQPQRAEAAPPITAPAPQEELALGRPQDGGAAQRSPHRERALDPRIGEVARVAGALGTVLVLLLLTRVMLRRMAGPLAGGRRPSGVLEVLARYPVARAQQLILLKMAGRIVLLHQSRAGMTALTEVTDPDEVARLLARVEAGSSPGGPGFPPLLNRLLARGPRSDDEVLAQVLGRSGGPDGKEVVDLTRRPRRRRGDREVVR